MTIPRIGDKIIRLKQTIPTPDSMEQIVIDPPSVSNTTEDFDNSLWDIIEEPQTENNEIVNITENGNEIPNEDFEYEYIRNQEINAITNDEPETNTQKELEQNPEQEDNKIESIEDFTKEYDKILHTQVLPHLENFEPIRKNTLLKANLASGTLILLGILVFIFINADKNGELATAFISGGIGTWIYFKKQFERKLKRKVMPTLLKAVPGFKWTEKITQNLSFWDMLKVIFNQSGDTAKNLLADVLISTDEISETMLFPYDKKCAKTFDDGFTGKYRGVSVDIAECEYKANKKQIFRGAIIRIEMNKNFDGMTVIRPKKNVEARNISDLKKAKLQEVKLEDININKMYDIYSTDQIEARYLLTTSFIERFQNIITAYNSKVSFCSFCGKYVYIAPYCKQDLFSIGDLTKPVADEKQFMQMFNEFASVLSLVDHFKLDKKLGL